MVLPYLDPMIYQEIQDISCKTYAMFNGVVNPTIKAGGIVFKPGYSGQFSYLAYMNCRVVYMYPYNIALCYEDPMVRQFSTIYTVIHELSHFEQDIDFGRYGKDEDGPYTNSIEMANDNRTMNFILSNLDKISTLMNNIGTEMVLNICKRLFTNCQGQDFIYIGLKKFYHKALMYFLGGAKDVPFLIDFVSSPHNIDQYQDIGFCFTDTRTGEERDVWIKKDWKLQPTDQINNVLYNFIIRYPTDSLLLYKKIIVSDNPKSIIGHIEIQPDLTIQCNPLEIV